MDHKDETIAGKMSPWIFSLLYPMETAANSPNVLCELDPAAQHDLGIDQIVAGFTNDKEQQKVQQIILNGKTHFWKNSPAGSKTKSLPHFDPF